MLFVRKVVRRLAIYLVTLIGASIVVFWLCNALPSDPAQVILGRNADPASVAALRHELGLDRSAFIRYFEWLVGMATGNLGESYISGRDIASLIAPKVAVTSWLVGLGILVALAIALPVGMYAAVKRREWQGIATMSIAQLGMTIPSFFLGILLVLFFSVYLRILPANGYVDLTNDPAEWARHLILPVASLAIVQGAILVRYVRSATVDVLNEDYFRTARAIGLPLWPALRRHGLRNIWLSVMTVLGLQLASLMVGAIVIESVFALPGLGQLLLSAVNQRDLLVVQDIVMFLVAGILVLNALIDISYAVIDPRLRRGEAT
jgi:peptide/nickel transport system permease protein